MKELGARIPAMRGAVRQSDRFEAVAQYGDTIGSSESPHAYLINLFVAILVAETRPRSAALRLDIQLSIAHPFHYFRIAMVT
jgi:hypothetical protein